MDNVRTSLTINLQIKSKKKGKNASMVLAKGPPIIKLKIVKKNQLII